MVVGGLRNGPRLYAGRDGNRPDLAGLRSGVVGRIRALRLVAARIVPARRLVEGDQDHAAVLICRRLLDRGYPLLEEGIDPRVSAGAPVEASAVVPVGAEIGRN